MMLTVKLACLSLLLSLGVAGEAHAQDVADVGPTLMCFEVENSRTSADAKRCPDGIPRVEAVMLSPSMHAAGFAEAVSDGLVELAANGTNPDVRLAAAAWLTVPGERIRPQDERLTGVVARIRRAYTETDDVVVRRTLVGRLQQQYEESEAIQLLQDVARDQDPDSRQAQWSVPYHAIRALANMGDSGRMALRELYEGDAVEDPVARGHLEHLSKTGNL